jgi:hypothetical protein
VDRFHAHGIFDTDSEGLRQRYLDRVMPLLREVNIRPPVDFRREGDTWIAQGSLPWERWDPVKRRLG